MRAPWTLGLLGLLAACGGHEAEREITDQQVVASPRARLTRIPTSAQRFGDDRMADAPAAQEAPALPTEIEVPERWVDLERSSMKLLHFSTGGDAPARVWFTPAGGRLLDNYNRFRGQMGMEPATDEADLMALSRMWVEPGTAPEESIPMIELAGRYESGGLVFEDAQQVIAFVLQPDMNLWFKIVGPAETVVAEREAFEVFVRSTLSFLKSAREEMEAASPHGAGPPPAPGADPNAAGIVPEESAGFAWTLPAGWTRGADRFMREATFQADAQTECYIALARGTGIANANRWRAQVGESAYDQAAFDALARLPMLGAQGILVEGEGAFTDMSGNTIDDAGLRGVICERPGLPTVFVKMVGPRESVAAQREAFDAFVRSLREGE